jgi:diadenosine tetraphosphate (Ap4A) HIT family hydrolase
MGWLFFFWAGAVFGLCPFCDPAVLDAQKFYEDDLVIALYTHKPVFPGHCLVIPKKHVERFEELTEAQIARMGAVLQKVHTAVTQVFGTGPYLLLQKNGSEVWQTVPHVHFHYIPRKPGDSSTLGFFLRMVLANAKGPLSPEVMQETTAQLRQALH